MMIYLHKILPFFLSPIAIIMALLFIGILFNRKLFLWSGFTLFLITTNPLVANYLFSTIEHPFQPQSPELATQADAVVVLSGMLSSIRTKDRTTTEWSDPDRFFSGVNLIKLNKAPILIFTAGKVPWTQETIAEGYILSEAAIELGIEKNKIRITKEVQNTFQEADAVSSILPSGSSILLVTSAFHMERAKLIFINKGLNVIPFAVDFKSQNYYKPITIMDFLPSSEAINMFSSAIREYIGRMYYKIILR